MSNPAEMTETGRRWNGPASDLVELEDADGLKHTAIMFHDEWRQHPAITDALSVIEGFLESPMVTGLVEIVGRDFSRACFVYPTGRVWSVAEIIRMLSDRGERGGIRAGLELMYTAGQILVEGAEAGEAQGVYSHGGLTPRRIMVKADGQVMVIGYGLPQVEILQFHATPNRLPREDSFRYCPPERMEARPENLSSDVFGLVLVAFELMTGKPVYDGLVNDIRQQAARSEGSRRLFRFREVLPESVRNVLAKVLRPDPSERYVLGQDFLDDVHSLLSDRAVPGPSLMDLMGELNSDQRRVGESMQMGSTQMVDGAELRNQLTEGALGRSSANAWQPRPDRKPIRHQTQASEPPEDVEKSTISGVSSRSDVEVESAFDALPDHEEGPSKARWSKVRRKVKRGGPSSSEAVADDGYEQASEIAPPVVVEEETVSPHSRDEEMSSAPKPPQVPPPSGRRVARRLGSTSQVVSEDTGDVPSVASTPTVPSQSSASPPTADDLLLQIRGSRDISGPQRRVESAAEVREASDQLEVTFGEDDDDQGATIMMTPQQLRAKLAQDGVSDVKKSRPKSPGSISPSPARDALVNLVCPDGRLIEFRGSADMSVAEMIARMVGVELVLPVDQAGEIQSWYRLERGGERVDPLATIETLKGVTLSVVNIVAQTRLVELSIRSKGKDIRFSNPMNTAVPIQGLVEHLRQWLSLPVGDWQLVKDAQPLSAHQILADFPGDGGLALQFSLRSI